MPINGSAHALIAREFERHFGVSPSRLTPIPTSGESIVCSATVGDRQMIFKSHEHAPSLHVEAWIAQRLEPTIVPVAKVLAFEGAPGRFPSAYVISEHLPGEQLPEALDAATPPDVVRQVGRLIREVHAVDVPGAGWLRVDGEEAHGVNDDWADAVEGDLVWFLTYAIKHELLDGDTIDRVWRAFASRVEQLRAAPGGALLHSDFRPEHVLVADGTVTGIIDFQGRAGDPVADLVKFSLWSGPGALEPLLTGYEAAPEIRAGIEERGPFYRVVYLGLVLRWFHERDRARAHLLPLLAERITEGARAL